MKYALISDIHSNYNALSKFVSSIDKLKVDKVIFSGDLAGYGSLSRDVLDLFLSMTPTGVTGNVDSDDYGVLKRGPIIVDNLFGVCHGSALNDKKYLLNPEDIGSDVYWMRENSIKLLFNGHTHMQTIFSTTDDGYKVHELKEMELNKSDYYVINPGSLGKPRDGYDARFMVFNSAEYTIKPYRFAI